ncbi:MAG: DUF169 domain-containing protein [Candidatus Desulforudis sp.]|nr:DUF169 domain-containing protein [Desulforudis sp.]
MRYAPVAVILTDEKPEGAVQFKEGRWGCVAALFAGAAKGKTAVFDEKTFGCLGGGTGLGFGNQYVHFPGGIEYFISTGNPDLAGAPEGEAVVRRRPELAEGERYVKSPEEARKFVESLPVTRVPTTYVVFKPLDQVTPEERPALVSFLATPDQLSALVVLAHYDRGGERVVFAPFGAGCHTVGIIPLAEARADKPRAVIGLTDVTVRRLVDKDLLSFTVPYEMFLQMDANVAGSFLEKEPWDKIRRRNS